jgi:hypothetical protein
LQGFAQIGRYSIRCAAPASALFAASANKYVASLRFRQYQNFGDYGAVEVFQQSYWEIFAALATPCKPSLTALD